MVNIMGADDLDFNIALILFYTGDTFCQNNAARMLSLHHKFDHITPVLKDIHWLPVEQRIEYNVRLLTYKALHGKAPEYIS